MFLQCVFSHDNSSINIVMTVSRPLLANSACAVNLLEESGTLVSHLKSREYYILLVQSVCTSVIVKSLKAFHKWFRYAIS